MDINLAAKCFAENCRLFNDPQTLPEKYNLYRGLENMALTVVNLCVKIDGLERQIADLRMRQAQGH
jgi:hypothetical protein